MNVSFIAPKLIFAALSLHMITTNSTAETNADATKGKAQNWSVSCVSRSRLAGAECSAEQRVLLRETGQQLGRLLIKAGANDTGPAALLLQIPLGVSIRAGVKIKVDGKDVDALDVQTCDASGCYAGGQLSEALLAAAKSGKLLNVEFSDTQQRAVTINFVLDGFSAAYNNIR